MPTSTVKKPRKPRKLKPIKTGANGRPSGWRPEYEQESYELCLAGYTDIQLSVHFDVSENTIGNWKKSHPEFAAAIRRGKAMADGKVAVSLYNRAIGLTVEEWRETLNRDGAIENLKTSKELPGDVHAQKFWLKNRQPDKWRENIGLTDGSGGVLGIHIHECLKPEPETEE